MVAHASSGSLKLFYIIKVTFVSFWVIHDQDDSNVSIASTYYPNLGTNSVDYYFNYTRCKIRSMKCEFVNTKISPPLCFFNLSYIRRVKSSSMCLLLLNKLSTFKNLSVKLRMTLKVLIDQVFTIIKWDEYHYLSNMSRFN